MTTLFGSAVAKSVMRTFVVAALAAVLLVGIADALAPAIDLGVTPADMTVLGDNEQDALGFSVTVGDLNNDGFGDLIVGASQASKTYVIYGGPSLPAVIDLNSTNADVTVSGDVSVGTSVGSSDVNGDGIDDMVIGAFFAGIADAGKTFVIYGSPDLPPAIDLDEGGADLTVLGKDAHDWLGWSVATGDINGDMIDDLVLGAYQADGSGLGTDCGEGQIGDHCGAGEAYVIFGAADLPAVIDLASQDADMTIYGEEANDRLGRSVAAGDINGDGFADVLLGADQAQPEGRFLAGRTYVVYGDETAPSEINLHDTVADVTVLGREPEDRSGHHLAAGDINNDGTSDLIISSVGPAQTTTGQVFVLYGGTLPTTIDLAQAGADISLIGHDTDDQLGQSVDTGDVNGDGTDDLLMGATGRSILEGTTYMVYGGSDLPTSLDFNNAKADLNVSGPGAGFTFGWSVSAGDLNGDSIDDIVVGASNADTPGGIEAGAVYVVLGAAADPVPIGDTNCDGTVNPLDAALVLQFSAGLIPSLPCVGAGDTNEDGITNPLDAALILQFAAGLLDSLPP